MPKLYFTIAERFSIIAAWRKPLALTWLVSCQLRRNLAKPRNNNVGFNLQAFKQTECPRVIKKNKQTDMQCSATFQVL